MTQSRRSPRSVAASTSSLGKGELRYVTVLVSDMCGSTRIAKAMDPEDHSDLLGALQQSFKDVVQRHGGKVASIAGDGVLAIFGHPDAHEDDGRRATEAAIDLQEAARGLKIGIPGFDPYVRLHSGIDSGVVLLKKGDLIRGALEPHGTATNIASHLADIAGADEILVTKSTLGAELYFFRSERRHVRLSDGTEIPPAPADEVAIFNILGRAPIENRFAARVRRGLTQFVGREAELADLQRHLAASVADKNQFVVLAGMEGLGKTRLANEFLAQASATGFAVHRGYCECYLGTGPQEPVLVAQPLQPFLQILRSVFRVEPAMSSELSREMVMQGIAGMGPTLAGHLDSLLHLLSRPSGAGESSARSTPAAAALVSALCALFAHLAETGPVLMFIDDWQWADDITRRALDRIRAIEGRGLFLLLATREDAEIEVATGGGAILHLPALTRREAEAAVGATLRNPEPFLIARIADHAGGNPLFIEELCLSTPQDAIKTRHKTTAGWLDALVASRFSRLSRKQADLVKAASVVGHMIPSWLFEEITGYAIDDPVVQDLARKDFIYHSEILGMLRFKHVITRDAIYRTVGRDDRLALHRRVVDALHSNSTMAGEDEHFETLAYHYGAAGDASKAADYAELAGKKAMSAASLDRAQAHYRAALDAIDKLEPTEANAKRWHADIRNLGFACVSDPSPDQLAIFEEAAERAQRQANEAEWAEALAWAQYWLGYINYGLGRCRKSITHCKLALKAAARRGSAQRNDWLTGQIRAALGQAYATACEYGPALDLLDEAIETKRNLRSGSRQSIGLAYSISCKGFVLADQGRFDAAYREFDEAIDILGGTPEEAGGQVHQLVASVVTQRSAACLWQGRMEEAARHAREGELIAERVKARYLFSMSRALAAYAQWRIDQSAEALAAMIAATTWLEASNSQQFLSLNYGWLTEATVTVGRFDEAKGYAERARRRARLGDRLGEAMAYRALARAALRGHGRHQAERYLALANISANARGSAHEAAKNHICAAEIALAVGEHGAADALIGQVRPHLAELGMDWFLAQADQLTATRATA